MSTKEENHIANLTEQQINGTISAVEFKELEGLLLATPEARELYLDLTHQHATLEEIGDSLVQEELHELHSRRITYIPWSLGAAAALVMAGLFFWLNTSTAPVVATLVSSDHASWESSLPTTPNAKLTSGFLKLITGVATIQFASGVEVILEAPAHLVLETPMKGKLLAGSAVIDVPEAAIGFIMETPDGFAIDHGTTFAVSVSENNNQSAFEVLAGKISVHHPASGEVLFLGDAEKIDANASGLFNSTAREEDGHLPGISNAIRLTTKGREATVIRGDNLDGYLHRDFLMAKRSGDFEHFDRRSLFSFTLPERPIHAAILRLNLVPCGLGFASRLPEVSTFAVYGVVDFDSALLNDALDWDKAPSPESGFRLASMEISRGQQSGNIEIQSDKLTQFLNQHRKRDVTFLLVRESDEAQGNGLVHAFASSQHPRAFGPILELAHSE